MRLHNGIMRRFAIESFEPGLVGTSSPPWLNLPQVAEVAVTSEDPQGPVELAFLGEAPGWRAGGTGDQTVRLLFDPPQRISRIFLRFVETETERTQEFSLRWSAERRGLSREIVRQQWNFSPSGATTEVEDYRVALDGVTVLELAINPDLNRRAVRATLAEWRIA